MAVGADTRVKGLANVCYKGEEGVAKGVVCREDGEGMQRRKKAITSLIRVKLRQLWKNTIIISLSLTSVFISLLFV
jgi:hypothetical protein